MLKEFEPLKAFILETAKSAIKDLGFDKVNVRLVESWCIISPNGAYNKKHTHPGALMSGSYYVSNPSSPITFHDPRPIKAFCDPTGSSKATNYNVLSVHVKPKEGDLLLFPSWLEHSVGENETDEDRVIVSFNFAVC